MEQKKGSDELMEKLKKALNKIKDQSAIIEKFREPIAIIGMSCRMPGGGNDIESFWDVLCSGKDCMSEVPPSRWNVEDYYDPSSGKPGKIITKKAGFITGDVSAFDADFFGISHREAEYLDPQQRLLLEVMFEAIEDAGIPSKDLARKPVGVFVGMSSHDYDDLIRDSDIAVTAQ